METIQARNKWSKIFKELKEKKKNPSTFLCPVEIPLKREVNYKNKFKVKVIQKSRAENSITRSIKGSHSGRRKGIKWKSGSIQRKTEHQ